MAGNDPKRSFLWHLWVPTGLLFLAALLWQQQVFETRKDCPVCGGAGRVPKWVRVPEEPEPPEVPCDSCGSFTGARLGRWAGLASRQLPDTPLAAWVWFSTLFAVALIGSFRRVRCHACGGGEDPGPGTCAVCGGRRSVTLLDRWLAG